MPWQLDEFVREKVERGRRLLAESDAYRGSTCLQNFILHADLTTRLHNAVLDDANQPRTGLSLQAKHQAMVLLLQGTLHNLASPLSLTLMSPQCFEASRNLAAELPGYVDPMSKTLGRLGQECLESQAELDGDPLPRRFERTAALAAGLQASPGVAPILEALQRRAGFDPVLTVAQLRAVPQFLQLNAGFRLATRGAAAQQYVSAALSAADALLERGPPQGSAAHLHWARADLLAMLRPAEGPAAYRAALRVAEQERAHVVATVAGLHLAEAVIKGRERPRWLPEEARQPLAAAEQAFAAAKAWLPQAAADTLRAELASMRKFVDSAVSSLLEISPLFAHAPESSYPTEPVEGAQQPEPCSGCQRRSLQLRRCSACRAAAYCSRDCQAKHWRAGHKQECAAVAQQRAKGQEEQGQEEGQSRPTER